MNRRVKVITLCVVAGTLVTSTAAQATSLNCALHGTDLQTIHVSFDENAGTVAFDTTGAMVTLAGTFSDTQITWKYNRPEIAMREDYTLNRTNGSLFRQMYHAGSAPFLTVWDCSVAEKKF